MSFYWFASYLPILDMSPFLLLWISVFFQFVSWVNFFHGILHCRETMGIQSNLLVFCLKVCACNLVLWSKSLPPTYIKIFFHISPTADLFSNVDLQLIWVYSEYGRHGASNSIFSSHFPNHLLNNLQLFSLICSSIFAYIEVPGLLSALFCGCSICSCTSSILFLSLCSNDIVSASRFSFALVFQKLDLFNIWFFFMEVFFIELY